MDYPTYIIYATADKVKAKLKEKQLDKQRNLLNECDGLQVVEIEGELKAAVEMDVYQFLVRFFMDRAETDRKDLK